RTTSVVRLGGDVRDRANLEACGLQRPDRGLPARTRALDEHIDLADSVLLGLAGGVLGGQLSGERGRLAGALEADIAGRRPGDDVALRVGDRHDRVVERALEVRAAGRDVFLLATATLLRLPGGRASGTLFCWWHLLPGLLLAG